MALPAQLMLPQPWERHQDNHNILIIHTNDFIVYLDHEFDVEWETTDAHDKKLEKDDVALGKISNRISALESIPLSQLAPEIRKAFRRMLGEAMARALESDIKAAHEMLDDAEAYVVARATERARFWRFVASSVSTGFLVVIASLVPIVLKDAVFITARNMAVSGALGSLLSVLIRLRDIPPSPSVATRMHWIEGAAKSLAGMIGAIFVLLAIRGGILFPAIPSTLALVVAFMAGASERFIPSMIERTEVALLDAQGAPKKTLAKGSRKSVSSKSAKPPDGTV
jgi:hypothetical protein